MAPRRVFLIGPQPDFVRALLHQLERLPPVVLPAHTQSQLTDLLQDARNLGGAILRDESEAGLRYAMVLRATGEMAITRTDIFAPVLGIFDMPHINAAIAAHAGCPYLLTAAVFGPELEARKLASQLPVGTVLINDIIVGTADPRVSFGGRKSSGFGVTRGREGLLEMTALKTIVTQNSRDRQAYRTTTPAHQTFFAGYIQAVHGGRWIARWHGLRRFLRAAARLD
jgi:aldehyde dehydrogenase (NAD+)